MEIVHSGDSPSSVSSGRIHPSSVSDQLRSSSVNGGLSSSSSKENQKLCLCFQLLDSEGDGRIKGFEVISFFALANLPRDVLSQVFELTPIDLAGSLGFREFVVAMKLISLAQRGRQLTSDLLGSADMKVFRFPKMELHRFLVEKMQTVKTFTEPVSIDSAGLFSQWKLFGSRSLKKVSSTKSVQAPMVSIALGLEQLYMEKLKPLETKYNFQDFMLPPMISSDFEAKPMVMLLGQHSDGKISFLKNLLERQYPGVTPWNLHANDHFVLVTYGPEGDNDCGNMMACSEEFTAVENFGQGFLSNFWCSRMKHPLLEDVSFVQTPAILSIDERSYDFIKAILWFAQKCDLILLCFDLHNLLISNEFKRVLSSLRGYDYKFRVVLNEVVDIDPLEATTACVSLMWSLAKVVKGREVCPAYLRFTEKGQKDLLCELKGLGDQERLCHRQVNDFLKRAKDAKIHAYIISHLKKKFPFKWRTTDPSRSFDDLEDDFVKVSQKFKIPLSDFPCTSRYEEILKGYNICKFKKLKPKMIEAVENMLDFDIPKIRDNSLFH